MFTIIWTFIKPYVQNVCTWVVIGLLVLVLGQTLRLRLLQAQYEVVQGKIETQAKEIESHHTEFVKMQELAKIQDAKLHAAYAENIEIQKRHAKNIERILTENTLPDTASCDDVAKWAKDIARRKDK